MNLIEVFERRSQLAHNSLGISPIHSADVIPFEGVDEALSHAVALRTADGCADGLKCIDPALPAQLKLLKHKLQQGSSF